MGPGDMFKIIHVVGLRPSSLWRTFDIGTARLGVCGFHLRMTVLTWWLFHGHIRPWTCWHNIIASLYFSRYQVCGVIKRQNLGNFPFSKSSNLIFNSAMLGNLCTGFWAYILNYISVEMGQRARLVWIWYICTVMYRV